MTAKRGREGRSPRLLPRPLRSPPTTYLTRPPWPFQPAPDHALSPILAIPRGGSHQPPSLPLLPISPPTATPNVVCARQRSPLLPSHHAARIIIHCGLRRAPRATLNSTMRVRGVVAGFASRSAKKVCLASDV